MGLIQIILRASVGSVFVYILYSLGKAVYNITLHPLAKYPGKKIDAAFDFPWHWRHCTGYSPYYIKNLHEQYGHVVRIGPDNLSYSNSQAWKDINAYQKGRKHLIRDPKQFAKPKDQAPGIILGTDADHTRARRVLAFSFSDSALREQEPLVQSYCNLLVTRLHEQIGKASEARVDIVKWFNCTTFDIIGELVFSESFHALETSSYHEWMINLFGAMKMIVLIQSSVAYPLPRFILQTMLKYIPAAQKARSKTKKDTRDKVERRMASTEEKKDFMSHILKHNNEKGLSREELITNSSTLILAGSETTATAMSGLIFLLLRNPSAMTRLQQEVRLAFTTTEEMNFINVAKLPYLHACIQEGLRVYPPSPSTFSRQVPAGGMVINGEFVPGLTSVGVHSLAAFHSSKNFKDPMAFIPERWLGDEKYTDDDLEVVRPFGMTGTFYCLGVKLAYAEMGSIIARLFWNFNMDLCEDSTDFLNQKIYMLWEKPALNIKLSSRF